MATNTSGPPWKANFVEQDEGHYEVRVPESNGPDTDENGTN